MRELSVKNCRLDRRYDVSDLLGRGSYAEIYLARDSIAAPDSPHSLVVIKALNVNMQNDLDPDLERTLVENFQNEAIALDRVRHPNVVSRLGHGTAKDLRGTIFHYLVLEYLAGGDLSKLCRERKLDLTTALGYIEQVCAGLAHAHRHGVIHRDIKPQNLLLTKDLKTVKIADFGVARFSQSETPITRVGTNMYAPPEHSPMLSAESGNLAHSELTPAADVYSLAKSVYVLVTGESPRMFSGRPISELPFAVRQEPWAGDLLRILERATRTAPAERHQSVEEFWRDVAPLAKLADSGEVATRVGQRPHATPQAHVARGYTPFAPQRPEFSTSRELRYQAGKLSAKDPSAVVRIDEPPVFQPQPNSPAAKFPAMQPPGPVRIPVVAPPTAELPAAATLNPEPAKPKRRILRRAAYFLIAAFVFTGALAATYYIVSNAELPRIASILPAKSGTTVRDVPLRVESNANSRQLGWVPANSRIRILGETETWLDVEVTEFGKPRDPAWPARGWIAKKTRTGDDNVDFSR